MPRFLVVLLLLILAPAPALSQQGGGGGGYYSYAALAKATPGQSAEYVLSRPGQAETSTIGYTLVEKTQKHMTIRMEIQTPMGMAMNRLVFQPAQDGSWTVTKASQQPPGGESQDVPIGKLPPTKISKNNEGLTQIGKERVSTMAGEFECYHLRKTTPQGRFDIWVNDKVMPTGVVKLADPGGLEMRLKSVGSTSTLKSR